MRSLLVAAALGLGLLGLIGATPSQANASWLSEALHARFDPNYYGTPAYGYYGLDYVVPPIYYSAPYYQPGVSSYWGGGPRYYGHWHGYRGALHAAPHTVSTVAVMPATSSIMRRCEVAVMATAGRSPSMKPPVSPPAARLAGTSFVIDYFYSSLRSHRSSSGVPPQDGFCHCRSISSIASFGSGTAPAGSCRPVSH